MEELLQSEHERCSSRGVGGSGGQRRESTTEVLVGRGGGRAGCGRAHLDRTGPVQAIGNCPHFGNDIVLFPLQLGRAQGGSVIPVQSRNGRELVNRTDRLDGIPA